MHVYTVPCKTNILIRRVIHSRKTLKLNLHAHVHMFITVAGVYNTQPVSASGSERKDLTVSVPPLYSVPTDTRQSVSNVHVAHNSGVKSEEL